ncbi:MAG TPA: hypothetical protein VF282_01735 [Bacillota bacterium]
MRRSRRGPREGNDLNVRRLAQCYRCRRVFAPRGDERYCRECLAELRRQRLLGGGWSRWQGLAVVLGGIGLIVGFVEGRGTLSTLLALGLVLAWYLTRRS